VITGALKNACGKPRPDIIDRCQPDESPVFGLSNYTMCTQQDHAILKDGFRSFPSGRLSIYIECFVFETELTVFCLYRS
jgi:diacylglycerol diphosphate phosphatase/phosphatidate phosphatase